VTKRKKKKQRKRETRGSNYKRIKKDTEEMKRKEIITWKQKGARTEIGVK